jgi:transposase-like protein
MDLTLQEVLLTNDTNPTHPSGGIIIKEMVLKKNTIYCPKCKEKLHFKVIGTMRVYDGNVYDARCPKCKITYSVQR